MENDTTDAVKKGHAFEPEKPTTAPNVQAPEPINLEEEVLEERVVLDPYTSPSLFIEVKPGLSINVDQITDLGRIHVEKEDKLYVFVTLSNAKTYNLEDEEAEIFLALLSQYRPILIRHGMLELPSEAVLTGKDEETIAKLS